MVSEIAGVAVDLSVGAGRIKPSGPILDSTRFREELGFAPECDIEKGVQEYME